MRTKLLLGMLALVLAAGQALAMHDIYNASPNYRVVCENDKCDVVEGTKLDVECDDPCTISLFATKLDTAGEPEITETGEIAEGKEFTLTVSEAKLKLDVSGKRPEIKEISVEDKPEQAYSIQDVDFPTVHKGDRFAFRSTTDFSYLASGKAEVEKGIVKDTELCGQSFPAVSGNEKKSMFNIFIKKKDDTRECALTYYKLYSLKDKREDELAYDCGDIAFFAKGGDARGLSCSPAQKEDAESNISCPSGDRFCVSSNFTFDAFGERFRVEPEHGFVNLVRRPKEAKEGSLSLKSKGFSYGNVEMENKEPTLTIFKEGKALLSESTLHIQKGLMTLNMKIQISGLESMEAKFSEEKLLSIGQVGWTAPGIESFAGINLRGVKVIDRKNGKYVTDKEGKRYLDKIDLTLVIDEFAFMPEVAEIPAGEAVPGTEETAKKDDLAEATAEPAAEDTITVTKKTDDGVVKTATTVSPSEAKGAEIAAMAPVVGEIAAMSVKGPEKKDEEKSEEDAEKPTITLPETKISVTDSGSIEEPEIGFAIKYYDTGREDECLFYDGEWYEPPGSGKSCAAKGDGYKPGLQKIAGELLNDESCGTNPSCTATFYCHTLKGGMALGYKDFGPLLKGKTRGELALSLASFISARVNEKCLPDTNSYPKIEETDRPILISAGKTLSIFDATYTPGDGWEIEESYPTGHYFDVMIREFLGSDIKSDYSSGLQTVADLHNLRCLETHFGKCTLYLTACGGEGEISASGNRMGVARALASLAGEICK